eukprot:211489-Pleurochrysis_carterae.AAC.3
MLSTSAFDKTYRSSRGFQGPSDISVRRAAHISALRHSHVAPAAPFGPRSRCALVGATPEAPAGQAARSSAPLDATPPTRQTDAIRTEAQIIRTEA